MTEWPKGVYIGFRVDRVVHAKYSMPALVFTLTLNFYICMYRKYNFLEPRGMFTLFTTF